MCVTDQSTSENLNGPRFKFSPILSCHVFIYNLRTRIVVVSPTWSSEDPVMSFMQKFLELNSWYLFNQYSNMLFSLPLVDGVRIVSRILTGFPGGGGDGGGGGVVLCFETRFHTTAQVGLEPSNLTPQPVECQTQVYINPLKVGFEVGKMVSQQDAHIKACGDSHGPQHLNGEDKESLSQSQ